MGAVVGIDLGTTNTVVATVVDGIALTLEDPHGRRLLPSVVSFHPSGNVLVGELARERRVVDAANTVHSAKRLIGRPWSSPEVVEARARLPYALVEGPSASTMVQSRGKTYALAEISAFVLRTVKKMAEETLGERVEGATITVPASFNEAQRSATKLAAELAGLEVLRIINEPTAAALAYGQRVEASSRVAVFDLGGGTFDITILDLRNDVFEVLSTAGDTSLGGDDIDTRVAEHLADRFLAQHRYDPREDAASFERLRFAAESLKCALSSTLAVQRKLEGIALGVGGRELSLDVALHRAELEALAMPFVDRAIAVCARALGAARLDAAGIDQVFLVGGSSVMPLVARRVEEFFGRKPTQHINPDEAVAIGAGIQAHALKGRVRKVRPAAKEAPKVRLATEMVRRARETFVQGALPREDTHEAVTQRPPKPVEDPEGFSLAARDPSAEEPSAELPAAVANKSVVLGQVGLVPAMRARVPTLMMEPDFTIPNHRATVPAPPVEVPAAAEIARTGTDDTTRALAAAPSPVAPLPRRGASLSFDSLDRTRAAPSPTGLRAPPPIDDPEPTRAVAPVHAADAHPADDPEPTVPPIFSSPPATLLSSPPAEEPSVSVSVEASEIVPVGPSTRTRTEGSLPFTLDLDFVSAPSRPPEKPLSLAPMMAPRPVVIRDEPRVLSAPAGSAVTMREHSSLLIDVTPLSLRIETAGGYSDVLLGANTPVPCQKTRTFRAARAGQARVLVRVAQGEHVRFEGNTFLGELELGGIQVPSTEHARIAVTFELDANGILGVVAKEAESGAEARATMRLEGVAQDGASLDAMRQRQDAVHLVRD